jgi:hypothetical protein
MFFFFSIYSTFRYFGKKKINIEYLEQEEEEEECILNLYLDIFSFFFPI